MTYISVQNVSKVFGEEQVLNHVSREFSPGQIHGIVGNNGSGKTVLMKCICGFLCPTSGKILVDGREIGKDVDFPPSLGAIIETPGFLPNLTGLKNLKLLASLRQKITESDIREAICRVGLDPELKKPVSKYSLGMRQRLGLAQAIMEDPELLILDEPFNGLDKTTVEHMRNLIAVLRGEGKTILLSSHNEADIDQLCDTVCEMDAGRMTMLRTAEAETRKISAHTQGLELFEDLTLLENAALPLAAKGIRKAERERQAAELLRKLGAGGVLHARPSMVTETQRQAVLDAQMILLGDEKR